MSVGASKVSDWWESIIMDHLSEGNTSYSYCGFQDLSYELRYDEVLDDVKLCQFLTTIIGWQTLLRTNLEQVT